MRLKEMRLRREEAEAASAASSAAAAALPSAAVQAAASPPPTTQQEAQPPTSVSPPRQAPVAGTSKPTLLERTAARKAVSEAKAEPDTSSPPVEVVTTPADSTAPEVKSQRQTNAEAKSKAPVADGTAAAASKESVEVSSQPEPAVDIHHPAVTPRADFIHRTISIEDLRPHTDSYDQLTEEIRLAGRFAAAGLIAQGLRLARLKDEALYKDTYGSFEEYCRAEHSMSATYAYRLIRMAEMAERIAEEGQKTVTATSTESMPDPFEVMLGLGHRHLMALLPLETETAEDLLIRGVPLSNQTGSPLERIPIAQATEQQIRHAISSFVHTEVEKAVRGVLRKESSAPAARSVRSVSDLVEALRDWAEWLEGEPSAKAVFDRVGEGRQINKLAQQLRKSGDRIFEALTSLPHSKR